MKITSHKLKFQSLAFQIREHIETQMRGAILATVDELFRQEIELLCDPIFSREGSSFAHRTGSDPSSLLAQGQRLGVMKPRAKKEGKDVELKSCKALQAL